MARETHLLSAFSTIKLTETFERQNGKNKFCSKLGVGSWK
jgi:hypothetical protein